MILVIDASVVLKWLFNDPATEPMTQEAQHLMLRKAFPIGQICGLTDWMKF